VSTNYRQIATQSSSPFPSFRFNKDLSSLKCEERQKNKLIELIRAALNEVSCEELPSGCDDLAVEIDNNNHEQMVRKLLLTFQRVILGLVKVANPGVWVNL
jgi:hypothetical protein